jgi:uncharacterized membrane protein
MAALTLAAAYLVRLAITAGWLTPVRQVMLTAVLGLTLIGLGFSVRRSNPRYAGLLPGCGVVVLFLADYGAHLYHKLIGPLPATAGVVIICLLALALGRIFAADFYALFAAIGSYSSPILLANLREAPTDLAIYFSAWSILYCWHSVTVARRQVYLLAAYLAFVVFDLVWHASTSPDWGMALAFQFVQFLIFSSTVVVFSVKHRTPLDLPVAKAHIPVLLLFYFVQYATLRQHLPAWAPWISFGSMGAVLAAYAVACASLQPPLAAGRLIASIYSAVVLLHAGYFELLPEHLRPWAALAFLIGLTAYAVARLEQAKRWWPLFAVGALVFLLNSARLLFGWEIVNVPGYRLLIPLYAAALYAGYWLSQRWTTLSTLQSALLYLGHVNVMAGAAQMFDERLVISLIWGCLAVTTLVFAIRVHHKPLARSALFVFAAFVAKVVCFDLSGSDSLVRIGCLLLLGASLYSGGLLYQKVDPPPRATTRKA